MRSRPGDDVERRLPRRGTPTRFPEASEVPTRGGAEVLPSGGPMSSSRRSGEKAGGGPHSPGRHTNPVSVAKADGEERSGAGTGRSGAGTEEVRSVRASAYTTT
ncbi:hypothetical protein [Methanosphaerula subterraneus]|uniref:hypothetical protein n=1 Tax=Methanosphaerula subterraneus TaxID=3350244 RepID=UPI003F8690BE